MRLSLLLSKLELSHLSKCWSLPLLLFTVYSAILSPSPKDLLAVLLFPRAYRLAVLHWSTPYLSPYSPSPLHRTWGINPHDPYLLSLIIFACDLVKIQANCFSACNSEFSQGSRRFNVDVAAIYFRMKIINCEQILHKITKIYFYFREGWQRLK